MTEVRPQLVICDLDGTLFDTEFAVSQITAELATQAGYPVSAQRVFRTVAGLGSKEKFRAIAAMSGQVLDEGLLASLSEQHRTRKAALYDHPDFKLIDGAGDLIKHLLAHQFTLAAATNNTYEGAAQALKRTGLLEAFEGRRTTGRNCAIAGAGRLFIVTGKNLCPPARGFVTPSGITIKSAAIAPRTLWTRRV